MGLAYLRCLLTSALSTVDATLSSELLSADAIMDDWQHFESSWAALECLPEYTYQELQPNEDTRVVTILPSSKPSDDIVCEIEHVSIKRSATTPNKSFEALSYVCGPDEPSRLIKCVNGTKLSIRPYLFDAIKALGVSDQPRTFWIDQLSVNQRDLSERAKQVRMFGQIFSSASQVRVWLRETDWNGIEAAFSLIKALYAQMIKREIMANDPALRGRVLESLLELPPVNAPECVAVRNLLHNEWFFRTWTFQEIALAKDGFFFCGPQKLAFSPFVLLGGLMSCFPNEAENTQDSRFKEGGEVLKRIAKARLIMKAAAQFPELRDTNHSRTLFNQITNARPSRCFDPRDKIWAVISTAIDVDDKLEVDYNRPWQAIYTRVCHWLHCRHKNLAFLQLVEIRVRKFVNGVIVNRDPELPSWVPDFRSQPYLTNLAYQKVEKLREYEVYYASGKAKSSVEVCDPYAPYLKVHGLKIGKIVTISSPSGNLQKGVGICEKVLEYGEWQTLARTCADKNGLYLHTKEPVELAFERLRIGDHIPGTAMRRGGAERPDKLPQPRLESFKTEDAGHGNGSFIIHSSRTDIGSLILYATTSRRMFITDTGYMGLTHRSNRVGDEIWVLMGAEMPVTLHPVERDGKQAHEFRGESYVHGIMDGEALVDARRKKDPEAMPQDKAWLDELGFEPWPFDVEHTILV